MIQTSADPFDVRSLSLTFSDGSHMGRHRHDWAQLIYARSGLMRVESAGQIWLVPPTRAIWIPVDAEHQKRTHIGPKFHIWIKVLDSSAFCVARKKARTVL